MEIKSKMLLKIEIIGSFEQIKQKAEFLLENVKNAKIPAQLWCAGGGGGGPSFGMKVVERDEPALGSGGNSGYAHFEAVIIGDDIPLIGIKHPSSVNELAGYCPLCTAPAKSESSGTDRTEIWCSNEACGIGIEDETVKAFSRWNALPRKKGGE